MTYETLTEVDTSKFGNGKGLNIRQSASSKGKVLIVAPNKSPIYVNSASESGGWIAVTYDGWYGYAMSKFIKGTSAYGTSASGSGNYDGTNINCKAKTTASTKLYASADSNATVLATIPSGKTIAVDSDLVPIATWLRAVYNNKLGYVKHATLNISKTPKYYGVKACVRYGAPLLTQGTQNNYVRVFKKDLYDAGWNNLTLNSTFDAAMKAAVKAFQAQEGIASDGIVGIDTKEKMYRVAEFG